MIAPLLEVQNLTLRVGGRTLAREFSFQLGAGEMWCLLGPNGAGKTTFLYTAVGLREPQGGALLLAGRALRKQMFPLTPQELGADFDLETVLRFGSLPLAWRASDRRATLFAYVQTYLREEIRAESIVRNLPGFARFLPVAALFHGQVINISGIARDAGTKVSCDIKKGSKVTVEYRMTAASIEVKDAKGVGKEAPGKPAAAGDTKGKQTGK